jgi:hypothetical protein
MRFVVRRAWVQVDEPAAAATDHQEFVRTGAVFEVGPDRDRVCVLHTAQRAYG